MSRKFRDQADWSDIALVSTKVGSGGAHDEDRDALKFDGYWYASREERMLAELLSLAGIAFTPDVTFALGAIQGKPRIFVPDFIFDRVPFIWSGQRPHSHGSIPSVLIHGIEAKGTNSKGQFSARARENVGRLWQSRRIRIILVANGDIRRYYKDGTLPMKPFLP